MDLTDLPIRSILSFVNLPNIMLKDFSPQAKKVLLFFLDARIFDRSKKTHPIFVDQWHGLETYRLNV